MNASSLPTITLSPARAPSLWIRVTEGTQVALIVLFLSLEVQTFHEVFLRAPLLELQHLWGSRARRKRNK